MRHHVISLPEQQRDGRRANLLARLQHEMRELLPRLHTQPPLALARKRRLPLPRPADRKDDPSAGPLQIPVRPAVGPIRRFAGDLVSRHRRRAALQRTRPHHKRIRTETLRRARVSTDAVQNKLARVLALERHIQPLDVLQNRRAAGAGVLEIDRPFDSREIEILDGDTADVQARLVVSVGHRMLGAAVVQSAGGPSGLPRQVAEGLAIVREGKRRLGSSTPDGLAPRPADFPRLRRISTPSTAPPRPVRQPSGPLPAPAHASPATRSAATTRRSRSRETSEVRAKPKSHDFGYGRLRAATYSPVEIACHVSPVSRKNRSISWRSGKDVCVPGLSTDRVATAPALQRLRSTARRRPGNRPSCRHRRRRLLSCPPRAPAAQERDPRHARSPPGCRAGRA